MRKLEDYTKEELIALYKRLDLYMATEYLNVESYYDNDASNIFKINKLWTGNRYSNPDNICFWYKNMYIDNAKRNLDTASSDKKAIYYKAQIAYYELIWKSLWYFASGWMKVKPEEKDLDDTKPMDAKTAFNHLIKHFPQQLDNLTINDEINKENGIATDFKTLQFVYKTLIYCSKEEIGSLIKLADKGLSTQWESIDINKNSSKKKVVKISENMPAKKLAKYNLEQGSCFESENALAEYCGVSPKQVRVWKKSNYIEEIENTKLSNDELIKIKSSLNLGI